MRRRALVVLNERAGAGTASGRWRHVRPHLERGLELEVVRGACWEEAARRRLERFDGDLVVAAGGDGTVSTVAATLVESGSEVALGAVGLGSSNDFHRGHRGAIAGVPARVDLTVARPADVVRCRTGLDGRPNGDRYFVVSASIGVTAEANHRFNALCRDHPRLRRTASTCTMLAAAVDSIRRHRPVDAELRIDGSAAGRWSLANLSLLKTRWLGAGLHYDTPVASDSGDMAVNACHDMGRLELGRLLAALGRGRFRGRHHTWHRRARFLELMTAEPALLELDGETVRMTSASFEVLPRRLRLCA